MQFRTFGFLAAGILSAGIVQAQTSTWIGKEIEDVIEEANASMFEIYKNRFYRCGELVADIAILSRSDNQDGINPVDLMIDTVKRKNPDLNDDGKLMALKSSFYEGKEERRKSFNGNVEELERHYVNAETVMTLYGLCLDVS